MLSLFFLAACGDAADLRDSVDAVRASQSGCARVVMLCEPSAMLHSMKDVFRTDASDSSPITCA